MKSSKSQLTRNDRLTPVKPQTGRPGGSREPFNGLRLVRNDQPTPARPQNRATVPAPGKLRTERRGTQPIKPKRNTSNPKGTSR